MIELRNVSKHFGSKKAVNQLNLKLSSGQVFAFLGPNGAGKTTTIKMMVGLLQPTVGDVVICGHNMKTEYLQGKRCLAYVPDQPYLYDKLSGREQLDFVGRMYDMPQPEIEKRIAELCDLFELHEYVDDLCENYSHGMKQRIVFSSALLHSPEAMIIDEPMVGLDPKSSRIVKNVLQDQAKQGVTVFMSTHSLEVAEETADLIGIIKSGELIALATLAELKEKLQHAGRLEEIFLELTDK